MRLGSIGREFKQFILRGNVIDLAVGIAIGVAFTGVVQSIVRNLLTPLVAAVFGRPDFSRLRFTVNHSVFTYGEVINAVVSFLAIAAAIFFFVVKPINLLESLHRQQDSPDPSTRKCPECLSEIPIQARRCAYCTAEVGALAGPAASAGGTS